MIAVFEKSVLVVYVGETPYSILQVTGELSVQNRRHLYHVRVDPAELGHRGVRAHPVAEPPGRFVPLQ